MPRDKRNHKGFLVTSVVLLLLLINPVFLPAPVSGALDYSTNSYLNNNNASYIGEHSMDFSGYPETMLGDINGDGIDDMMVSAYQNSELASQQGKVYLIFGKASGWQSGLSLRIADASIRGDPTNSRCGMNPSAAGDVNGDGFSDFIFMCGNQGFAKYYLFFGKATGWTKNMSVSTADVQIGGQQLGGIAANLDINGDGFDDFVIGSEYHGTVNQAVGYANVFFGRPTWPLSLSMADANASYKGTVAGDWVGDMLFSIGDVDADGFDDFLVHATVSTNNSGRLYMVLGHRAGWTYNSSLANANATFIGENSLDMFGWAAVGLGDVNGDHIDDFAVGAAYQSWNYYQNGFTYLFFGRRDGWRLDMDINQANATLIGCQDYEDSGGSIAGAGDVNGDGLNDIVIGAFGNSQNGYRSGKTYLVLGRTAGWGAKMSLSNAEASFIGENANDVSGEVTGGSDVNNDGHDDIMIGAEDNAEGGIAAGKSYLIFPQQGYRPNAISSVKAYRDLARTKIATWTNLSDTVHLELKATDLGPSSRDVTQVTVTSSKSDTEGILLDLKETTETSGTFVGDLAFSDHSSARHGFVNATHLENITVTSVKDPTKSCKFQIIDLHLFPADDKTEILEDSIYQSHYWTNDGQGIVWDVSTNASWLSWNSPLHNLTGTPVNDDVGKYWVVVNASLPGKTWKTHQFTITVQNTPPVITTTNVVLANEDSPYIVDYNSSEGDSVRTRWSMEVSLWPGLSINNLTGMLSGLPDDAQVGHHHVYVHVDDGNGAKASTDFDLTIKNINEGPVITSQDVTTAIEDSLYKVQYNMTDEDLGDTHHWSVTTPAEWLTMDPAKGVLSGTPDDIDVGTTPVNVTVCDGLKACDSHLFNLSVVNVNEPPTWTTVPVDSTINWTDHFSTGALATDVDNGTVLRYGLTSVPATDASINATTGRIDWDPEAPRNYLFIVNATDGSFTIEYEFNVTVLKGAPKIELLSPLDGSAINETYVVLKAGLVDPMLVSGDLVTVTFYVSEDPVTVTALDPGSKVDSPLFLSKAKLQGEVLVAGPLVRERTYYWTAVPMLENLTGPAAAVRSFKIVDNVTFNNHPPVIKSIGPKEVSAGSKLHFTVSATDQDAGDQAKLNYSLKNAPTGMAISSDGTVSWTPTKDQVGTYNVTVKVSDGIASTEMTYTVTVKASTNPPPKPNPVSSMNWLPYIILPIIIVIGGVGAYLVLRNRKT
jgi:hypothetical protein